MRNLALILALAVGCVIQKPPPADPCNLGGKSPCTELGRTRCVNEDGNARCLCGEGLVARPSGACEPIGSTNCPEHAGDTAEPDDCMARAKPVKIGDAPRSQTVDPIGDYDFFTFDGTAKHVYVVTVKPEGALLPRADLFDQGGVWLASDERTGKAQLAVKARATAPHYFRVSQSPLDPSVAVAGYTMTFATTGLEDHGDGPQEATAIAATVYGQAESAINGRFEYTGDQDWFSFSGTTGQNYRLSLDTSKAAPPLVSLYAGGKTDVPKWTAQQGTIDFDLQANETVYLVLYGQKELGSYSFTFVRWAK
ncbi:MAG: hypothetical protein HYZ28_26980 [Myxococcales bacterium]|nr:hypothetical protein [Myxococcales bacterium]